jgi:hypothetical protein
MKKIVVAACSLFMIVTACNDSATDSTNTQDTTNTMQQDNTRQGDTIGVGSDTLDRSLDTLPKRQ